MIFRLHAGPPDFADAHFNIAAIYQRTQKPAEARKHWNRYLEFDGASYWAGIARARIHLLL